MSDKIFIHLGETDFAGKGSGSYSGGTLKLSKDYSSDVLSSARQFFATARYCLNDGKIEKGRETFLVPGIVCAAFCCELSLKWLIFRTTACEEKGHIFSDLFEKLNSDDKKETSKFCKDFNEFLKRNNNMFVDARYQHEKPIFAFREQEILRFAEYLMQYIERLIEAKNA